MRKFLLLPLVLVLAACQPAEAETDVVTSGGVEVVDALIRDMAEILEAEMLPYWPYFQTWDTCIINGETLNNVTFMYTDLGLGYMVDDVLWYRLEMEVESCQTVILEVSDTESNIR
jgi:hypothetical protein